MNSDDRNTTMDQNPNITKEISLKIFISIISGVIGFWLSQHPFVFLLPPYELKFIAGLVFPLIVSLEWGWRYGLVSAIFGLGAQVMGIKGGWESVVTYFLFALWIVWHGWSAEKFRKTGKKIWNRYAAELPFRLFNTIILYTVFRWIFQLNPPPWAPEITQTSVSLQYVNYKALGAAFNGYLVLLLSNVLILFGPLRKVLRRHEIIEQKRSNYLLGTAILIGCVFWVVDGAFSLIFRDLPNSMTAKGSDTLLDLVVFNVPPYALFERLSFFIALLTGVLLASRYINKYSETEKLLTRMVELSPYPITVVDTSGRVDYINPEFIESFGYKLEDIPTVQDWYSRIFPNIFERREFITHWKEDMQKAVKSKTEARPFNVTAKDGSIQNIIFRQVIVNEEKEYIICENVSERIRAEERFRALNEELEQRVKKRTAQLEATNKELESFSYSVSHDLRAPLRSIDGFSMALLEEYKDQLDAEGQDYLGRVRSASQRMGQIIDDLLSLSRISRRELKKQEVNLSEIAQRIVEKLQESDSDRNIDIVIGHRVTADCDPNLIEVVLENLLGNAWKFTSKRDKPWIIFDTVVQDDELVYCVRDNGAGFDMAYTNKLFGAFQRLHKDTDFHGYGIGLATVQRIVHRHGGRIWAEGYVDRGATFYFAL
jgi:PAS domain S-box-containing protein